jgi:hypothetical protein
MADRTAREQRREGRFDEVLSSISGSPFYANRQAREVLFVIHDVQHDANLRLRDTNGRRLANFDLAIIGAPVWVRDASSSSEYTPDAAGNRNYQVGSTPVPASQIVAPTYFRDPIARRDIWSSAPAHGYTEQWREWDKISSRFADYILGRTTGLDTSEPVTAEYLAHEVDRLVITKEKWEDLCRWFSDQAQSFGGAALELHIHPRRKLIPWRYDNTEYVPSGRYGRLIRTNEPQGWGDETALVLTDGTVVQSSEGGFVDGDDEVTAIQIADHRKWSIAMLLQAATWRAYPFE